MEGMQDLGALQTNLAELAYKAIFNAILRYQFKPGQRIYIDELAREMRISETPVKNALSKLAGEGVVQIVPRRGVFVAQFDGEKLKQAFDARLMCELYALSKVVRTIDPEDLQLLESLIDQYETYIVEATDEAYGCCVDADRKFHETIVRLGGNDMILEWFRRLNVHVQIHRLSYAAHWSRAKEAATEHRGVVEGLRNHDLEAASAALRSNIEHSLAGALRSLESLPIDRVLENARL